MQKAVLAVAAAVLLAACSGAEDGAKDEAPATTAPAQEAQAAPTPTPEPEQPAAQFAGLPAPYNEASYSVGRRTFRLCSSCHLLEDGAGHLVGPNLSGLFERRVGSAEGFNYSPALQEADFQWTPEQLDSWLANPNGFLRGNRMSFAGVRRPADRTAVIAYIMAETGYQGTDE